MPWDLDELATQFGNATKRGNGNPLFMDPFTVLAEAHLNMVIKHPQNVIIDQAFNPTARRLQSLRMPTIAADSADHQGKSERHT